MHHEPAALDCQCEASAVFGRVPRSQYRNDVLIFSIWIRSSCTGSIVLAISTNFYGRLFQGRRRYGFRRISL